MKPALLLIPGWCSSPRVFEPLLDGLGKSHRILTAELTDDIAGVVEASGEERIVPVALSHAGWAAIELRKRFGERIPKLVFLDWIILDPPPPFLAALDALQDERSWRPVRDQLFAMWLAGSGNGRLSKFLEEDMGSYGFDMWARAGREIGAAYREQGSPLEALSRLQPSVPVLHVYAQPDDPAYLAAQQDVAARNDWFHVVKLQAQTHFPMFEVPGELVKAIDAFV